MMHTVEVVGGSPGSAKLKERLTKPSAPETNKEATRGVILCYRLTRDPQTDTHTILATTFLDSETYCPKHPTHLSRKGS